MYRCCSRVRCWDKGTILKERILSVGSPTARSFVSSHFENLRLSLQTKNEEAATRVKTSVRCLTVLVMAKSLFFKWRLFATKRILIVLILLFCGNKTEVYTKCRQLSGHYLRIHKLCRCSGLAPPSTEPVIDFLWFTRQRTLYRGVRAAFVIVFRTCFKMLKRCPKCVWPRNDFSNELSTQ